MIKSWEYNKSVERMKEENRSKERELISQRTQIIENEKHIKTFST